MKKKLLAIAVAVLTLVALFSCSGNGGIGGKNLIYGNGIKAHIVYDTDKMRDVDYSAELASGLRLSEKRVLKLENGRCQMTEGFFDMGDRGTYIFENHQVKEVALVTPAGRPYITVSFDMPLVAVWSPEKKSAPFVCIEPWCGRCDRIDFTGSLEEREWGNALEAGSVFETGYSIRIDK